MAHPLLREKSRQLWRLFFVLRPSLSPVNKRISLNVFKISAVSLPKRSKRNVINESTLSSWGQCFEGGAMYACNMQCFDHKV